MGELAGYKECSKCKWEKPLDDFHRDRTHKDGYRSCCKECVREYQKSRPKRTPERRAYELMYYYGMTEAEYEDLLCGQCGVCAICGTNPEGRLAVDHNHDTKRVRGLLCRPCNSAIGLLKDSPEILRRAVEYLCR